MHIFQRSIQKTFCNILPQNFHSRYGLQILPSAFHSKTKTFYSASDEDECWLLCGFLRRIIKTAGQINKAAITPSSE